MQYIKIVEFQLLFQSITMATHIMMESLSQLFPLVPTLLLDVKIVELMLTHLSGLLMEEQDGFVISVAAITM